MFLSTIGSSLSLAFILAVIHFPRAVPVEFILAGPLFTVLGGGSTVLVANLYSILSDVVAPAERYVLDQEYLSLNGYNILDEQTC